ncbi:hypothetical protein HELRODRAFT_168674 [Helobdella robusta]|uniref:Uncharacterized protein n=1 Tax=Helobdella robusta TaxID=6412 RepID=T1F0U7_HELRO|nr:hypothetical protein HELRODRAFT_168674 [Helobdella robusta]ESO08770.1 hypothetical protein HELRODRAFT_168674 [Helobdella robusta]
MFCLICYFILYTVVILFILYLLFLAYLKLTTGKCVSDAKLDNKTVVITGADKGIGYETALDLARRNAKVIMACRDLENAKKMAEKIKSETGNKEVYVRYLDVSNLAGVRKFATDFLKDEKRLDVLINNAGMLSASQDIVRTSEGFEITFVTNYLGPFFLTSLLLDRLKKCAPSRIVNVSSMVHTSTTETDLKDLNSEHSKNVKMLYSRSKALQILSTKELSRQLEGTGVTVNCLHPGIVDTNIFSKMKGLFSVIVKIIIFLKLAKTSKDGAQTSIYAAVDENLKNVSGQYLSDCRITASSKLTQDMALAKKVFDISEDYLGKF